MKRNILVGPVRGNTTFARINRQWIFGIRARNIPIEVARDLGSLRMRNSQVVVHHDYRVPLAKITRPKTKRFILVRSWDFGPYPNDWVKLINQQVDELWVYSHFVRTHAVRSGVLAKKVRVIPLGFDQRVFGTGSVQRDRKGLTRFLFVGGANQRKGLDILLDAFQLAFERTDAVELVVKAHTSIFYPKNRDLLGGRRTKGNIRVISAHLDDCDLEKLYRSASVVVLPYRAEGFALPLLEAMASGTPVLAPRFGPCLDYCTEENSFLMECQTIDLPVRGTLAYNALGFREKIDRVVYCETSPRELATHLKRIHRLKKEKLIRIGTRAAADVRRGMTWEHSVDGFLKGML